MMSRPASSCARIASTVASSCAWARYGSGMRQSSFARTRGGKRPASFWRSISHSGCGALPTSVVGSSTASGLQALEQLLAPELDPGLPLVEEDVGGGEGVGEGGGQERARADDVDRRARVREHLALEQVEARRGDDLRRVEARLVERLAQLDHR